MSCQCFLWLGHIFCAQARKGILDPMKLPVMDVIDFAAISDTDDLPLAVASPATGQTKSGRTSYKNGRPWVCATSRIRTTPSDICADGTGHIRLSPLSSRQRNQGCWSLGWGWQAKVRIVGLTVQIWSWKQPSESRMLRYALRKSDPLYGYWFFRFY